MEDHELDFIKQVKETVDLISKEYIGNQQSLLKYITTLNIAVLGGIVTIKTVANKAHLSAISIKLFSYSSIGFLLSTIGCLLGLYFAQKLFTYPMIIFNFAQKISKELKEAGVTALEKKDEIIERVSSSFKSETDKVTRSGKSSDKSLIFSLVMTTLGLFLLVLAAIN